MLLEDLIEVYRLNHTIIRGNAEQGEESHPDSNTQVIVRILEGSALLILNLGSFVNSIVKNAAKIISMHPRVKPGAKYTAGKASGFGGRENP